MTLKTGAPDLTGQQCPKMYTQHESKRGLLMADVKIEARPNGPYVVTGAIELCDTNGNVLATQERTVLCRCGASTKKPFCDGTHSKIGFQAAAEAVPASAEKS
jgi:CDGSH-type Zn-finger protein